MGMPAAFDNTCAALSAGATSIGNLGQYFAFCLPQWHDDIMITTQTVKAIALCAAHALGHNDLPIDVARQLSAAGAIPCRHLEDMLFNLLQKNR